MSKIKPTEAEIALHREQGRLKQVAAHHCGAFVELSRGVEQGVLRDGRPGKAAVARMLAMILQQQAEIAVIKKELLGNVMTPGEYADALTAELAEMNRVFADKINGNELGLIASFAFSPVADPEPKEVADGSQ